jgi:hypothetical protein
LYAFSVESAGSNHRGEIAPSDGVAAVASAV